jgi:rhodanese-related sulfurtransferase
LRNVSPDAVLETLKGRAAREIAEMKHLTALWTVVLFGSLAAAHGQPARNIYQATLGETGQRTVEVSTDQLRGILADMSAVVLDARPLREYAITHIPAAMNVAAKPGVPMLAYVSDVAEVGRLLQGKNQTPLVLYCNGPYCGKSKRLAEELLAAGYTNVRRYQLGIPVWRALGGVTEIEPDGLRYVAANDQTAVLLDVREVEDFRSGSFPNARNIPRSGVLEGKDVGDVKRAKHDGDCPVESRCGAVVLGSSQPLPPLSSGGVSIDEP